MNKFLLATFAFGLAVGAGSFSQARDLRITPVQQKTAVWCWLAVGEMVFEHYNVPDVNPAGIFQCGIVGVIALHGLANPICNLDCGQCIEPAGTAARLEKMLELYPSVLRQNGRFGDRIRVRHGNSRLSKDDIVTEIDSGNPVVAGITPGRNLGGFRGGGSAHVALIVGYRDGGRTLIVNDPYPYQGWNPYEASGATELRRLKYEIDYDDFRLDLNWGESWTVEMVSGGGNSGNRGVRDNSGGLAKYCCTPAGRLGPYPPGIPAGDDCYGTHPALGTVYGSACY